MKRYIRSSLITDGINDEINDELEQAIYDYLDTNIGNNNISIVSEVWEVATDDNIYQCQVYFDYRDDVAGNHPFTFSDENINVDKMCNVIDKFLTDKGFIIIKSCKPSFYNRNYSQSCYVEFEV